MSTDRRSGFIPGLLVGALVALAGVAIALELSGGLGNGDGLSEEAAEVIEDSYFEPIRERELDEASVEGMVRQLRQRHDDRFSHYFTPKDLKAFDAATSGRFSGVGLTVSEVPKGLRVASVIPDTPAKAAGIQRGDVIVAVDGESIARQDSEVSAARIKGPPGTEVELRIVPVEGGSPREVPVERAEVRVPAVDGELRRFAGEPIAYVRFATFSRGAHGELRDTIERLFRRGAQGLVLDLRGNGGGLLNEAVLAASLFVEDGVVVTTESRTRGTRRYDAVGEALDPRPTVVLINRDTASAAEILAAALQTYDLAELVGTRSFGKGSFQEVIQLDSGGALDLTVGEYLTAEGISIADEGVKPDVRAEDSPRTRSDEALRAGLRELATQLR